MIIALLAACLYLPFLSINYDLNGVLEAFSLEVGYVIPQNHLLFRLVAFFVYEFLRVVGYEGRSLEIQQILTAVCGAFGVGFAYMAFYRLSQQRAMAAAAALWWGTTWAYWYFSTDVTYITPAAMLVAAALAMSLNTESISSAAALGTVVGLAILAWEPNVFLIPVFILQRIFARGDAQGPRPALFVGVFLTSCFLLITVLWLGIGFFVYDYGSAGEFLQWAVGYGGSKLPMWGQLGLERLRPLATTAVESLLPLRSRLDPGEFVGVVVPGPGFAFGLSVLAALVLTGLVVVKAISWRTEIFKGPNSVVWLLAGYVIYIPFNFWWDPYEAKWFVVPNLFLGALIAVLASRGELLRTRALLFTSILAIAMANFSSTIWPRHARPRFAVKLANCVAQNMGEQDLFLATDWSWAGYLDYLHHRRVVSLIDLTAQVREKDLALQEARKNVIAAQVKQGKVYMLDLDSYKPEHLAWLRAQTGITLDDLNRFESSPAFTCNSAKVRVLTPMLPRLGSIQRSE